VNSRVYLNGKNAIGATIGVMIGSLFTHHEDIHLASGAQVFHTLHLLWPRLWATALGILCVWVPITLFQLRRDKRAASLEPQGEA